MSKKVLIIEDASLMRLMLKKIFIEIGYQVVGEAENGEMGVAMYKELKPDVTTMDITMPVMDGITALKEIMTINPKAVVIVCSAVSNQNMVIESLKAGAREFIAKPFSKEKIMEVLDKVIEQKEINSENIIIDKNEKNLIAQSSGGSEATSRGFEQKQDIPLVKNAQNNITSTSNNDKIISSINKEVKPIKKTAEIKPEIKIIEKTIKLIPDNEGIYSANGCWILKTNNITLKDEISEKDILISGLPNGLTVNFEKLGKKDLVIWVKGNLGKLSSFLYSVIIIMRSSAFIEKAEDAEILRVQIEVEKAHDEAILTPLVIKEVEQIEGQIEQKIIEGTIRLSKNKGIKPSQTDNWKININKGKLKENLKADDLYIEGLPKGLSISLEKTTDNTLIVHPVGQLLEPFRNVKIISLIIKGSAVIEDLEDSELIELELHPPLEKMGIITLSGIINLEKENQKAIEFEQWELCFNKGTLIREFLEHRMIIDGIPSGLKPIIGVLDDNKTVTIKLTGTADTTIKKPTKIFVSFKASAVAENSTDSTIIELELLPAIIHLQVRVLNQHIEMASGNKNVPKGSVWLLQIEEATFKNTVSEADFIVSNLPDGLELSFEKKYPDTIAVYVEGKTSVAIKEETSISLIIKASAINENVTASPANELFLKPIKKRGWLF